MKTINNYRDTKFVRVLDSTYNADKDKKAMIGDVCEVRKEDYFDKTLAVYTKDESNYHYFNKSDLQECYPDFVIDGHMLGVGDEIKKYGDIYTVFDITWNYDGLNIFTYRNGNTGDIYRDTPEELKNFTLHSTVYKKDKTVELTLEDIATKFGIKVSDLKIKK